MDVDAWILESRRREASEHPAKRLGLPALRRSREYLETDSLELYQLAVGGRIRVPKALLELSSSIALWTAAMARIEVSGPASIDAGVDANEPRPATDPQNMPVVQAELDALSFFAVGDMVLGAFASAELSRRRHRSRDWPTLMRVLDEEPRNATQAAARLLDASLRMGRNRLLAHRLSEHWNMDIWWVDGSVILGRRDFAGTPKADRLLLELNEGLSDPSEATDRMELLRHVLKHADSFDKARRDHLEGVTKVVGFVSPTYASMAARVHHLVQALIGAAVPSDESPC